MKRMYKDSETTLSRKLRIKATYNVTKFPHQPDILERAFHETHSSPEIIPVVDYFTVCSLHIWGDISQIMHYLPQTRQPGGF